MIANLEKIKRPSIFHPMYVLWVLTTGLIFFRLSTPQQIIFDETYFIPSAQKYLNGVFFLENHPPLGKLLIAAGEALYSGNTVRPDFISVEKIGAGWPANFDITGFRVMPAFFGTFVPLILFLILEKLTGDRWLSFGFACVLAVDTAFLMQSRIAMLDVFILFFMFLSVLIFLHLFERKEVNKGFILLLCSLGLAGACCANIKDTGMIVLVLPAILVLKYLIQKKPGLILLTGGVYLVVFLLVYLGLWAIHFATAKTILNNNDYGISEASREILVSDPQENSWLKIFSVQISEAFRYHVDYNKGVPDLKLGSPDEIGSPWYYWPFGGDAINFRWETPDGKNYRYSYLVGNPFTWLISLLGVFLGTSTVIANLVFKFLPKNGFRTSLFIFTGLYWCYIIPFWFIKRVMYLYHYLPAMVLGLIIFAILLQFLVQKSFTTKIWVLLGMVTAAAICFFLLNPFIYYGLLSHAAFNLRNFWPLWQLHWVGGN
jgi:dolichyl-phosphate-mannose-protein mannosyltransferase